MVARDATRSEQILTARKNQVLFAWLDEQRTRSRRAQRTSEAEMHSPCTPLLEIFVKALDTSDSLDAEMTRRIRCTSI